MTSSLQEESESESGEESSEVSESEESGLEEDVPPAKPKATPTTKKVIHSVRSRGSLGAFCSHCLMKS